MSELIGRHDNRATIRWKLLTGASALALASYLSATAPARAADGERPLVWFEADGQFSLLSADREAFLPPFIVNSQFDDAAKIARKKPPSEWDEGGKISFQPADSDWLLSVGIRYGKSHRQEASNPYTKQAGGYWSKYYTGVQNSKGSTSEKHLIVDFQAGKDVGLGRIGSQGTSVVSAGVRFAQFDSRSNLTLRSITAAVPSSYYIFHGAFDAKRDFRGIGPSLSWDASANLTGNDSDGSITFDWGVNAALLFGRQRVKAHHQRTSEYQSQTAKYYPSLRTTVYHTSASPVRSKRVTVPNLGGYAALSLRYTNAKISFGYRADAFFGAIDGGIDAVKKEQRGFYGPFASVSIGVGN